MLSKRKNTGFGNICNKNWSGDYELGTMLSHLGLTRSEREFSGGYQDTEISVPELGLRLRVQLLMLINTGLT